MEEKKRGCSVKPNMNPGPGPEVLPDGTLVPMPTVAITKGTDDDEKKFQEINATKLQAMWRGYSHRQNLLLEQIVGIIKNCKKERFRNFGGPEGLWREILKNNFLPLDNLLSQNPKDINDMEVKQLLEKVPELVTDKLAKFVHAQVTAYYTRLKQRLERFSNSERHVDVFAQAANSSSSAE
jgi:hypothetical protein